MAKPNIHPQTKPFTIIFPDGSKFVTMSTSKADSVIVEIHFKNHHVWTGEMSAKANLHATQVAKFNKKYAGISSLTGQTNKSENTSSNTQEDSHRAE